MTNLINKKVESKSTRSQLRSWLFQIVPTVVVAAGVWLAVPETWSIWVTSLTDEQAASLASLVALVWGSSVRANDNKAFGSR